MQGSVQAWLLGAALRSAPRRSALPWLLACSAHARQSWQQGQRLCALSWICSTFLLTVPYVYFCQQVPGAARGR